LMVARRWWLSPRRSWISSSKSLIWVVACWFNSHSIQFWLSKWTFSIKARMQWEWVRIIWCSSSKWEKKRSLPWVRQFTIISIT
jgi:hypothetical protein